MQHSCKGDLDTWMVGGGGGGWAGSQSKKNEVSFTALCLPCKERWPNINNFPWEDYHW